MFASNAIPVFEMAVGDPTEAGIRIERDVTVVAGVTAEVNAG